MTTLTGSLSHRGGDNVNNAYIGAELFCSKKPDTSRPETMLTWASEEIIIEICGNGWRLFEKVLHMEKFVYVCSHSVESANITSLMPFSILLLLPLTTHIPFISISEKEVGFWRWFQQEYLLALHQRAFIASHLLRPTSCKLHETRIFVIFVFRTKNGTQKALNTCWMK